MIRTGVSQLNVCTAPHTGPTGSPIVAFASRSTTHVCVQMLVSAGSPVTATGVSVPFPLVLGKLWLAVVIRVVL